MKNKVANQLAEKIIMYLSVRGKWDLGKSEKRRREVKALLTPEKPLISSIERSRSRFTTHRRAVDNLINAIFKQNSNAIP